MYGSPLTGADAREDLDAIRGLLARRGSEPKLDLAGLSAIHRVVVLSRAYETIRRNTRARSTPLRACERG